MTEKKFKYLHTMIRVIDLEKSIKLVGIKYIQAKGNEATITTSNAGNIRLIRLS